MEWYIRLAETGLIPDFLVRFGIRWILRRRMGEFRRMDVETEGRYIANLFEKFSQGPIAVSVARANEQHYELPPEFFGLFLGKHRKYSCGYWPVSTNTSSRALTGEALDDALDASEEAMLELTAERAQIEDGHRILDLGCGWGSLSLYAAQRFPEAEVTAVSGSKDQIEYIKSEALRRRLDNLHAELSDINDYRPLEQFDRVISVEMFEHMKNYRELLRRISEWLVPGGKLFVHIFSHIRYPFEYPENGSWMARTFFTGGTMPSDYLLLYFLDGYTVDKHWRVSGLHYRNTLRAWLRKYDHNRSRILSILESVYGSREAKRWFMYWRLFLLGCEETFTLGGGKEFLVSHYLFLKR